MLCSVCPYLKTQILLSSPREPLTRQVSSHSASPGPAPCVEGISVFRVTALVWQGSGGSVTRRVFARPAGHGKAAPGQDLLRQERAHHSCSPWTAQMGRHDSWVGVDACLMFLFSSSSNVLSAKEMMHDYFLKTKSILPSPSNAVF